MKRKAQYIKSLINDRSGNTYIKTAILLICLCMVFSVILFVAGTVRSIWMTEHFTEQVLESYITENSIEIYNSIKQGHDFTEGINEIMFNEEIISKMERFSLDKSNNCIYNITEDGQILFIMTIPDISFETENQLRIRAEYSFIKPVTFAGNHLFDMKIPMAVYSNLTPKI